MRCLVVEFQVQLTFKSHRTFLTFEWESEILNTKLQLKMILRRLLTWACDVCKKAKVKCSGGNPCKRCQSRDITCKTFVHPFVLSLVGC